MKKPDTTHRSQEIELKLALPVRTNKAERGLRLAQGAPGAALHAQPPVLTPDATPLEAAQRVIRETFNQFTGNLSLLVTSDDPEVVHQARVGWRRFKSALRLFRPILAPQVLPSWQNLKPLLTFLGELRDLDVALTETLPPLAEAFSTGNALRQGKWQILMQALTQAAALQRKSVRYALMDPVVGATLLSTTHWIEALAVDSAANDDIRSALQPWARRRIVRLNDRLRVARKNAGTPENLHRARILAKRLRYGIEALRPLLPQKSAERWYLRAAKLQMRIGSVRDVAQACALASRLDVDPAVIEFLRGYAAGQQKPG